MRQTWAPTVQMMDVHEHPFLARLVWIISAYKKPLLMTRVTWFSLDLIHEWWKSHIRWDWQTVSGVCDGEAGARPDDEALCLPLYVAVLHLLRWAVGSGQKNKVTEKQFVHSVGRLTLHERVRSLTIWENLRVDPLLLLIDT